MDRDKSPDWDRYEKMITESPGKRLPGFPFFNRFPPVYSGQRYELILVTGEKVEASVNDHREFMSEGLEWQVGRATKSNSAVAAWRRIAEIEIEKGP